MNVGSRVALVTGAARGVGLETARRLGAAGITIAMADIAPFVHEAAASIRCADVPAEGFVADVSDEGAVRDLVASVATRFGSPDILVNNAGIVIRRDGLRISTEETTLDEWNRIMAVNLTSAFLLCRECVPAMRAKGWGRIINISSMGARTASKFSSSAYCASKAGLIGFARLVASEVAGAGITVNCIAPGRLMTSMVSTAEASNAAALAMYPVGRLGTAEDIAATAAFLASDDASFITGAVMDVNGGAFMA